MGARVVTSGCPQSLPVVTGHFDGEKGQNKDTRLSEFSALVREAYEGKRLPRQLLDGRCTRKPTYHSLCAWTDPIRALDFQLTQTSPDLTGQTLRCLIASRALN